MSHYVPMHDTVGQGSGLKQDEFQSTPTATIASKTHRCQALCQTISRHTIKLFRQRAKSEEYHDNHRHPDKLYIEGTCAQNEPHPLILTNSPTQSLWPTLLKLYNYACTVTE